MSRHLWSEPDLAKLRAWYADHKTAWIAEQLGIDLRRVYAKARAIGLRKSAAFLSSEASGRLQREGHRGHTTRFKPGQPSWNKGRKGYQPGGRSAETQFKKGERRGVAVKLYQPIGTERISKDGYLERKINDGMPLQKRWRAVHLLVWEAANGPLPKGHAVCFRDGNKQNIALDNLELVSRSELMRRNTVHQMPKELAQLVQLRGAITRQINKRTRKDAA